MQLSISNLLALALVPAAVLATPTPADQSPNLARRDNNWVWACDSGTFSGNCGAVQPVNPNWVCYSWGALFPGIGNGSFKSGTGTTIFFWDGPNCSGTKSGPVCAQEVSRNDYWYNHTQSIQVTNIAC